MNVASFLFFSLYFLFIQFLSTKKNGKKKGHGDTDMVPDWLAIQLPMKIRINARADLVYKYTTDNYYNWEFR